MIILSNVECDQGIQKMPKTWINFGEVVAQFFTIKRYNKAVENLEPHFMGDGRGSRNFRKLRKAILYYCLIKILLISLRLFVCQQLFLMCFHCFKQLYGIVFGKANAGSIFSKRNVDCFVKVQGWSQMFPT